MSLTASESNNLLVADKSTRHPIGLVTLFMTEVWERFGFYIVQGLLVFYITQVFGFDDSKSYSIVGAFTAFAYITPIIGGYIADQVLGFRTVIIWGGILLCIAYGLLAILGGKVIYLALGIIVTGTGFLKPNISSLLGTLYQKGDTRRDSGFTLFYMGINVGVLIATSMSGFVKDHFGWNVVFALACLGLLIATITFIMGQKKIQVETKNYQWVKSKNKIILLLHNKFIFIIVAILAILLLSALIKHETIANILMGVTSVILLFMLITLVMRQTDKAAAQKLTALIVLIISAIVFWAIYFQMFLSESLFAERVVNRHIFNTTFPAVLFLSFQAGFIILLAPILARTWQVLNRRGTNPSTVMKFALATFCLAISFLLLVLGIHLHNAQGLVSPFWMILAYFFVSFGEMLLSPIGLSAVTILSPPRYVGMLMGVWFISLGLGGKFSGVIAQVASIPTNISNPLLELPYYQHAFLLYAGISILVSIMILMLVPKLKKLMHESSATF
jgi:POT family proton-dependent oligopeptide transporter